MEQNSKIYVAGGDTLIGAAIVRRLERQSNIELVGQPGAEPELTQANAVDQFFSEAQPDYVFLAAGESGGILANQRYPAQLMLNNLLIECHVIESAYRHSVKKLLYLASSCSYPQLAPQPMPVEVLLTGPLEPTNEAYAVAKIAGVKLCQAYRQQYGANFICGIPANSFGIGDDFSLDNSHVVPALIRKMHQAKLEDAPAVEIWGTGTPKREFVYVEDLAEACTFLMQHYNEPLPINIGGGINVSIRELAFSIREVVGYSGELQFDQSKPDGMPLKALESTPLLSMGWRPKTALMDALAETYTWFLLNFPQKALAHA